MLRTDAFHALDGNREGCSAGARGPRHDGPAALGMAMGEKSEDEFVDARLREFQQVTMNALLARLGDRPELVRQVVAGVRAKLDALVTVMGDPDDDGPAPATASGAGAGNRVPVPSNGRAAGPDPHRFDSLGRNQRSRVRELIVLEAMAAKEGACTIDDLLAAIKAEGLDDTPAAIVSQLHRLKNLGIIDQPHNGLYEITNDGLAHARKLRTAFARFLRP